MKHCWEVTNRPASMYLQCVAYKEKLNCWEVKDIPCCKRENKDRCKECSVYQAAFKEE